MTARSEIPELGPRLEVAEDRHLPELGRLFDRDWVWAAYRGQARNGAAGSPQRFRVRQFVHSPGRMAFARYEAQWQVEAYRAPGQFVARLERERPTECFLYPFDERLPGLAAAAEPEGALGLANAHVLNMRARRSRVQLVTYRPGYRAVLRHRFGRVKLYARVVRPFELPRLLDAHEITKSSGFVIPSLAGYAEAEGIIWLTQVEGASLRRRIRQGKMPDAALILEGLERLWQRPLDSRSGRAFGLPGAFRSARRSFRHHLRDHAYAMGIMNEAVRDLEPFVRSWSPTSTAHNDFYDNQMLVMGDGRIALVDFEEAGPGDALLDVGSFLAHLIWSAEFSRAKHAEASRQYYYSFKAAALERFGWDERDLRMREAVCLFRVCTNFIRHPQENWRAKLERGLGMVNELLG